MVDQGEQGGEIGGGLVTGLECAHGQYVQVSETGGVGVGGGETKAASCGEVGCKQRFETGLVERQLPAGQFGDLAGVGVYSEDVVTYLGQADRAGGTEVTGAEHCAAHDYSPSRRGVKRATMTVRLSSRTSVPLNPPYMVMSRNRLRTNISWSWTRV